MKRHFVTAALAALLSLPGFAQASDATAGQPKEHIVQVVSDMETGAMYFEPKEIRIAPGDTVTWINQGEVAHSMMTYPDGYPRGASAFQSPDLTEAGARWSYRFETAGSFEYHCVPHILMDMEGTVIVGQASEDAEFHQPSAAEIGAYRELLLEYFDEDEGVDYRPRSERLASGPVKSGQQAHNHRH